MRKILLLIMMFTAVPLYAGHGSAKPEDSKGGLVKTVIELLNSKSKKDTVKKRKDDRKKRKKKKTKKKRSR